MKIIAKSNVAKRLNDVLLNGELSDISRLVSNPIVYVDWYHVNKDLSVYQSGLDNMGGTVISTESTIIFDKIENVPVGGIDNLLMPSEFDEDLGSHVEFNADGFVFPNTIEVHENDYFIVRELKQMGKSLIFRANSHKRNYVKNMSIIEFEFSLAHDDPQKVIDLEAQVHDVYECLAQSIGTESTLVVKKTSVIDANLTIREYLELVEHYIDLFYDRKSRVNSIEVQMNNMTVKYIDKYLEEFMVRNRVIYFDKIQMFAVNNYGYGERSFMIDYGHLLHSYKSFVMEGIVRKDFSKFNKVVPIYTLMSPEVVKYLSQNVIMVLEYRDSSKIYDPKIPITNYQGQMEVHDIAYLNVFDEDFITRITTNNKYGDNSIRDLIISYYNNQPYNIDSLEITNEPSPDNFYLIPIILHIMSQDISKIFNNPIH
jgi:hypothetical protein